MNFSEKIKCSQEFLRAINCDGWLLYDFRKNNDLACCFLQISESQMLTRRLFYWVPSKGTPIKINHRVEQDVLDHLPGENLLYSSWQELNSCLSLFLAGKQKIAMEYSPNNEIPYICKVDGGTLEQIRSFGVEIVSSGNLLQKYTSVWSEQQLKLHQEVAKHLDQVANLAWDWIAGSLEQKQKITEVDVQEFILNEFKVRDCVSDHPPICAVNANSANPHYCPLRSSAAEIQLGDFIQIDLWCKKNHEQGVYADIARVAIAATEPTQEHQKIFDVVKNARDKAMEFLLSRLNSGSTIMGWEVDQVCRSVIEKEGYGAYFTHRTGHNIGKKVHGDGANIDNFETKDTRFLLPGTCFSIEPGVYLPGKFGVRLEHDVYLDFDGKKMHFTPGLQNKIECLIKR